MHYRIRHLAVAGAMTMRGRLFLPCALAVLGFGVHPAKAVDFTGEVQIVTVPGKDKSVQRSLTELSAYLEYALLRRPANSARF